MSDQQVKASRPVHEIRLGSTKATVWANKVANGTIMHNTVLVRIYRDDAGQWHETHSLGRDDLLTAAKVLDLVHSYVFLEAERK